MVEKTAHKKMYEGSVIMNAWNAVTTNPEEGKRQPGANRLVVPLAGKKFVGWYTLSLLLILSLAACLDFWQLGRYGFSNLYYAAGVRSMLSSWHNSFFASFDPGGFISVDKPPVDFWIQVLSAKLFGFSPFSLLLPQALAGVLSVALLAHLVRRRFGALAGLVAALALTLTPISVITSRNNDVDSMLVLVVMLAAWAVIIATEQGSLCWLLLSMGIVGLGFNIKMLEAYLVVPAFVLLYFFASPRNWRTRIWHMALALVVLFVISLSWIMAVDHTPPAQRPYVGSSGNNTELHLAFGYNGVGRVFNRHPAPTPGPGTMPPRKTAVPSLPVASSHVVISLDGLPGPTRLFGKELAGQISWLLPLALLGMIVLLWRKRPSLLHDKHFQGFMLWGGWFLTTATFFSFVSGFQIYYLVMFAPPICALVGIGAATLWHEYTNIGMRGFLFPIALFITAGVQLYFLTPFPAWRNSLLTPILFCVTLIVGLGLLVLRVWRRDKFYRLSTQYMVVGLLVLMLAPAIWAAVPVLQNRNSAFPVAGPYGTTLPSGASIVLLASPYSPDKALTENTLSITDLKLLNFLGKNENGAKYLYATTTSDYSAVAIVQTGKAIMTMAGYAGNDSVLTLNQLINLVQHHAMRYFLLPATIPTPLIGINLWIKSECMRVPVSAWYTHTLLPPEVHLARLLLFDCINPHPHKVKSKPFAHLHHVHATRRKPLKL